MLRSMGSRESDTTERLDSNNVRGSLAVSPREFWGTCNIYMYEHCSVT